MKILGVDPGSVICGYGVVESHSGKFSVVEYGVVRVRKKSIELPVRLKEIYLRITEVIKRTCPDAAVFESLFFSKNVQSLVKLSHARAAAVLAAAMYDLPITEYSPREIKKSVTGNGNASKEQVQYMVKTLLKIDETPEFFDVTDALAAAVCHSFRANMPRKATNSWSDYIKQNPAKVIR